MTTRDEVISLLTWSSWEPLFGSWLKNRLPSLPGIYRIRRAGRSDLDYIGQTGSGDMTLKKRMGMLRDVYMPLMPYRAPHTAGPALWALRHASDCDFEVSVAPVETSAPWREGLKCVAISLYRQEHGVSPTANFGRMPLGYRMSSGNNAKLRATNQRRRGGVTTDRDSNHAPGISPIAPLAGNPLSREWCGHVWSLWTPVSAIDQRIAPNTPGLFRIRYADKSGLLRIGQGRVYTHLEGYQRRLEFLDARQSGSTSHSPVCSWVLNDSWEPHQRLELECDLIAAYILYTGEVPTEQFTSR